jgi:uncharacterized protein (TIGR03067 family)
MPRISALVAGVLLACPAAASLGAPAPQQKSDEELLEGTWQVTSILANGRKETGGPERILTFKRGAITITLGSAGEVFTGKYTLNASKNPKEVDLVFDNGPDPGQAMKGIYTVTAKELTLCIGNRPRKDRPTKFESKPDSDVGLLTLQRKKP